MKLARRLSMAGLLAAGVVLLAACGRPESGPRHEPPAPDRDPIDPVLAVATFDTAWALIDRNHFDPQHEGVDWAAVREELRPRALAITDRGALRELVGELVGRTGLSHFALFPEPVADALGAGDGDDGVGAVTGARDGSVGLDVRLVDDQVLVWRVEPGSPADQAGIGPGWLVEAIGATELAAVLAQVADAAVSEPPSVQILMLVRGRLDGPVGSKLALTLRDPDGRQRNLALTRTRLPGVVNRLGNLPPIRTRLEDRLLEQDGLRVAVIRFNIWLLPVATAFDAAIDRYRDADAVILDLRGNLGGVGVMAMGMAGHFLTEPVSLGEMRTRDSTLQFRVNPRRSNPAGARVEPFTGPVAILQDQLSLSTSEIFARGLQHLGRARVFGETTGGAALPSRLERLPSGDVLQYAFADYVDPQGTRLEGRGVIPDEVLPLTRADLLAGRDAPLEAALSWIRAYHAGVPAP